MGSGSTPLSARDCFYRYLHAKRTDILERLLLAEDLQDWMSDAVYADLITLERHLAGLADLVVLFVESPGSIAELGSFVLVPEIANKLLVFMRANEFRKNSFIALGPLRYFEYEYTKYVSVYDWNYSDFDKKIIDADSVYNFSEDMAADIDDALSIISSTKRFDPKDPGHAMLLMADLADLFLAVKISEYQEYFSRFGHNIETSEIKRYIFLLQKLGMVSHHPYGHERYYCNAVNSKHMKYSFKESGLHFDRMRLKAEVSEYYSEHDKRRNAMIKSRGKTGAI